jgi:hypothetical protein
MRYFTLISPFIVDLFCPLTIFYPFLSSFSFSPHYFSSFPFPLEGLDGHFVLANSAPAGDVLAAMGACGGQPGLHGCHGVQQD